METAQKNTPVGVIGRQGICLFQMFERVKNGGGRAADGFRLASTAEQV